VYSSTPWTFEIVPSEHCHPVTRLGIINNQWNVHWNGILQLLAISVLHMSRHFILGTKLAQIDIRWETDNKPHETPAFGGPLLGGSTYSMTYLTLQTMRLKITQQLLLLVVQVL